MDIRTDLSKYKISSKTDTEVSFTWKLNDLSYKCNYEAERAHRSYLEDLEALFH